MKNTVNTLVTRLKNERHPAREIRAHLRRRRSSALMILASLSLTAACGATSATGAVSSTSSSDDSQGTVWSTITSQVRTASIGASPSDTLAANADTTQATDAATSAEQQGGWDTDSATTITLSDDGSQVSGDAASSVSVDGSTLTISAGGTYVLSGTLSAGSITVNAPDADVHLILNGVSITGADGPAITIQDADSAVIVLAQGTTNTLVDAATYADASDDAPTATLFSSDTLTITGTGTLNVTGNNNDAISSKNGLAFTGNPTVTLTATDDGIRGKDWLLIAGGTFTITAGGDGLKSTEDNDETKGFVALSEATLTIASGDDGISATTDVTVHNATVNITAGGGQSNATVEGPGGGRGGFAGQGGGPGQGTAPEQGTAPTQGGAPDQSGDTTSSSQSTTQGGQDATASADSQEANKPKGINAGVIYSQDSGSVTIDAADEGLQAAFPTISGGELTILSDDDGINATNGDYTIEGYENADSESDDGAYLTITGGAVQVSYASSDGIDSNGSANVSGGQVLISGQAGSMDGSVDVNGESTTVGVTGSPSVSSGDTVTVTGDDGSSWTLTSAFTSSAITVIGLSEGSQYTVATTSGGSATGTAQALSAGAGMGGQAGPGGQGGQPRG